MSDTVAGVLPERAEVSRRLLSLSQLAGDLPVLEPISTALLVWGNWVASDEPPSRERLAEELQVLADDAGRHSYLLRLELRALLNQVNTSIVLGPGPHA